MWPNYYRINDLSDLAKRADLVEDDMGEENEKMTDIRIYLDDDNF